MKFRESPLKQLQPRRLRKLLTLFFFAMALPTALLVYQSYDQLKWEAFYQHRQLAEELAGRVDQKLKEFVRREEERSFSEYRFLLSDGKTSFAQRSPLSAFPAAQNSSGVVGYFQIDAQGDFSTPLLPGNSSNADVTGLSRQEIEQRRAAQNQVEEILSSNQLVEKPKEEKASDELAISKPDDYAGDFSISKSESSIASSDSSSRVSRSVTNQAAFDDLSNAKQSKRGAGVLDRLYELELDSPYKDRVGQREQEERKRKASSVEQKANSKAQVFVDKKSIRSDKAKATSSVAESLVLPNENESSLGATETPVAEKTASTGMELFSSEFDSFETSLLDSGHFVMYRRVWRAGERYIQGLIVEQDTFINRMIGDSYSQSLLANMSSLTLVYQGNVLNSFATPGSRSASYRGSDQLSGALLYRTRLSEPFNQLENVFTVRRLPAGPGGRVVVWAALIMGLVLGIGCFLIYRMSLRNLLLVRQQQDFVSAVSHELKTPLTSIRMYGEMLQEGWVDEAKKKGYYRYIFDESERLTRLINNVLQLARMTRSDTAVELKRVTIGELIDVINSKVDSQVQRSDFLLTVKVDDAISESDVPIHLLVDPDVFAQVIINLVDNALKFSVKAARKEIEISVTLHAMGKVSFSVRDYGPGIAQDQFKKIFDLFYRSEDEFTRETTGTGIGLALVSQLMKLMSGNIDVVNRDPGAEFCLTFALLESTDGVY